MSDNEIKKALECCTDNDINSCEKCPIKIECYTETIDCKKEALDLINRQQADNERLKKLLEEADVNYNKCAKRFYKEGVKEFAEKVDEILKRYAHLHKYAEKARHSTEEYADGTPMEMVSVWEVLSLKKWEMCDYETMSTLQDNIETIEKARLLSELEKDFMLLKKEMVGDAE